MSLCEIINNVAHINSIVFDHIPYDKLKHIRYDGITISDIKDYNYKDKIVLAMFINKHVHISPLISKYNKYKYLLQDDKQPLNITTYFRNLFVSSDILNNININDYKYILHIGTLPAFIESLILKKCSAELHFMRTKTMKLNVKIYNDLMDKFNRQYNEKYYFYQDDEPKKQFDLIIFDTYKNLSPYNFNDNRYLSSVIHFQYIYNQFAYAMTKLNKNGSLILLFPGYNTYYNQLLLLLASCFDTVKCVHSELDFSFRYFVICSGFNKSISIPIEPIIDNVITIPKTGDNTILFHDKLINKFADISNKLVVYKKFINNETIIKKIYYEIYYSQLCNTSKWIDRTFNINLVNDDIFQMLYEYKIYVTQKLKSKKIYTFNYTIKYDELEYIYENIENETCKQLLPCLQYQKLYKFARPDSGKPNIGLKYIKNIKKDNIIKFTLNDITPLMLSIFYMLANAAGNYSFIKSADEPNNYLYICKFNKLPQFDIDETKISNSTQIIIISDNFINMFNNVISRFIIKDTLYALRHNYMC